mgnify:CR=1 FL=1
MKQLTSIFGILGTALLLSMSASFASDLRAPTPSAAAELLSPVSDDLYQYLDEQEERLLGKHKMEEYISKSFGKAIHRFKRWKTR